MTYVCFGAAQVLDILGRHWEARSMRHPPYMQPSQLSGVTKAEQVALAAPTVAAVIAAKVRACSGQSCPYVLLCDVCSRCARL